MTSQQQDLIFYSDGSLLSFNNDDSLPLHIISYHDGTAPMWLSATLVENCLVGTANLVNRDIKADKERDCSVVFVSFLNPEEPFKKLCRKYTVDTDSVSLFEYLDYSSTLFTSKVKPLKATKSQTSSIFEEIADCLKQMPSSNKVVFLDAPEILLAATDLQSNDLLAGIRKLSLIATVIPIISVHDSNFNLGSTIPQDATFRLTDFYVKLFHSSSLNINLKPLATGKAADITGSLTITRGAVPLSTNMEIVEREYVFQVTKDAATKLYYR